MSNSGDFWHCNSLYEAFHQENSIFVFALYFGSANLQGDKLGSEYIQFKQTFTINPLLSWNVLGCYAQPKQQTSSVSKSSKFGGKQIDKDENNNIVQLVLLLSRPYPSVLTTFQSWFSHSEHLREQNRKISALMNLRSHKEHQKISDNHK